MNKSFKQDVEQNSVESINILKGEAVFASTFEWWLVLALADLLNMRDKHLPSSSAAYLLQSPNLPLVNLSRPAFPLVDAPLITLSLLLWLVGLDILRSHWWRDRRWSVGGDAARWEEYMRGKEGE